MVYELIENDTLGIILLFFGRYYEAEAPGLGHRFRAEIDSVVERMADNPRQFPMVFKTLRRARAKKFPSADNPFPNSAWAARR